VKLSPACNAACLKATACRWQGDNERDKHLTVLENLHLLVIVYSAKDSIPNCKRGKGRQKKIVETKIGLVFRFVPHERKTTTIWLTSPMRCDLQTTSLV
jgi:hypothetical protein